MTDPSLTLSEVALFGEKSQQGQTPTAFNSTAQGRAAHPGSRRGAIKDPNGVQQTCCRTPLGFMVYVQISTQGALRDPGLWSTTALRLAKAQHQKA